jgi:hypothetical protein
MGCAAPLPGRRIAVAAGLLLAVVMTSCATNDGAVPPVENTTTLPAPSPSAGTITAPPPYSSGATITGPGPSGGLPPRPAGSRPCAGHPTAECTGVPAGVRLRPLANEEDGVYRANTLGEVIDGRHITGDLVITANDVTVRNSQIDGWVINERDGITYRFTISDSTVGPVSGCQTLPGVAQAGYRATRVLIRNHGDGFRVSGDDVVVEDSYVHMCSNPGDHSDGVQDHPSGSNVTIRHNTFDQRDAPDHTAPIFLNRVSNLTVADNLVMGGTYSIRVYAKAGGPVTVRDNLVVNGTWDYGPVDADCAAIAWSGNQLVEIDANYRVTRTVGPLPC